MSILVVRLLCGAATAFALHGELVRAQAYPAKPIRMIVPFSPGGPTDAIARTLAQRLSVGFSQQVVVDNRPGANAIIGTELGARAAPDGYTLTMVAFPHAINPSMQAKLPYDTVADFAPVSLVTSGPMLLAAHPSVPVRDIKGLIALARARPDDLTCASSGNGSTAHLALAMLNYLGNIKIMHIAYKGAGQGMTDLLGGHVSMYFGGVMALLPHVKDGKLKGLAVSTPKRSEGAPLIPTIAESGMAGYDVSGWYGVIAPARTPQSVIARVNTEIVSQLQNAEVKERLRANGAEVVASTPEQFGVYIERELVKWAKIVKAAGIRAD